MSPVTFLNGKSEPAPVHCRFGDMDASDTVIHIVVLVIAVLGILISLAGIAFWWVSRKMNRLT
jgi:hypothetical protein